MCLKYHDNYQQAGYLFWGLPYSVSCWLLRDLAGSGFERHPITLRVRVLLVLLVRFRNWSVCITSKGKTSALHCSGSSKRFARWGDVLRIKVGEGTLLAQPYPYPRISPITGTFQKVSVVLLLAWKEELALRFWNWEHYRSSCVICLCKIKYNNPSERDFNSFSLNPCGTLFIFTCHLILRSLSQSSLRSHDTQASTSSCWDVCCWASSWDASCSPWVCKRMLSVQKDRLLPYRLLLWMYTVVAVLCPPVCITSSPLLEASHCLQTSPLKLLQLVLPAVASLFSFSFHCSSFKMKLKWDLTQLLGLGEGRRLTGRFLSSLQSSRNSVWEHVWPSETWRCFDQFSKPLGSLWFWKDLTVWAPFTGKTEA